MKNKSNKALLAASQRVLDLTKKRRRRTAAQVEANTPLPTLPDESAAEISAQDGTQPANGGFEGAGLARAEDNVDLGEEDFGARIPPELAQQIDEGKAEDAVDESYQPGILVPPGLEDAVMAVVDPSSLSAAESVDFDMIPFMPAGATTAAEVLNAGAHWIICANGDPLAKISLCDQDNADKIAAHFVHHDYAKSVVEGISKHGLKATLEFVSAKPYVAKVDANAKIVEIKEQLTAAAAASQRAALADTKSKFVENIALVLQADSTNFLPPNALKAGLVTWAMSAGVPEAVAVEGIDNEFFSNGPKALAAILEQSETWGNYAPEALAQVKATVEQSGRRTRALPSQLSPADANPEYNQSLANRMEARAVGIQQTAVDNSVTAHVGNPEPASDMDKESFRKSFGRFGS